MERVARMAEKAIGIGFLLLVFFVPLILTPWNYELFEYNKMMLVYALTAVIAASWGVKMIAQKKIAVAKTPLDIPILLFVASQLVSTLFSIDPHVSWIGYYSRFNGGMVSVISYVILYYAFVSHITVFQKSSAVKAIKQIKNAKLSIVPEPSIPFLKNLLAFTLVSGCLVAMYGIAEHLGIDKHIWVQDVQARVFSTLGQPNWLAAYLAALLPMTIALMLQKFDTGSEKNETDLKSNTVLRLGFGIVSNVGFWISIVFFLTLLFTRSRSGLAAFAIVDIAFWTILFLKKQMAMKTKIAFFVLHGVFAITLFSFGIGVPAVDRWITAKSWNARIMAVVQKNRQPVKSASPSANLDTSNNAVTPQGPVLETGGTESGIIRKYVWEAALTAWDANWKNRIIGTGTETFAWTFYQYKPAGHNGTSEWDFLYNKAHNEYLNFLATTGMFGLGSYLIVIGMILSWFIKTIRANTQNTHTSFFNASLFAGWCSLLITNFFGFSVVVTQLLFFLIPAVFFVFNGDTGKQEYKKELPLSDGLAKGCMAVAVVLVISCLAFLSVIWWADKTYTAGYRFSRAGLSAKAYQPLSDAIRLNPNEPIYHDEYANTLASLALAAAQNQDATLAATLASYALAQNDRALAISPGNVNFWKSRTKILYALSDLDPSLLPDAVKALQRARTLSPNDPKILYNLAILSGRTGDGRQAMDYLKEAIRLKPNYRDAYYALYLFYNDMKETDEAKAIITKYLTTVDSQDLEFQKLVQ